MASPSGDAAGLLPTWLRWNRLPRRVADPVESTFLECDLPSPIPHLSALAELSGAAEHGILTVRRDHGTKTDAMDPAAFERYVLFMLRAARDDILTKTAKAFIPVVNTRLDQLIDATKKTLGTLLAEPLDRIVCDTQGCAKRGAHVLAGPWIDAMERSGEARNVAWELVRLVGCGENGRENAPDHAADVALTANHESILRFLGRTPTKCKTVIDVSSTGTIRNRETVGRLLRELARIGMVDRPHGTRKGYALTDSGRRWLSGAELT